MNRPSPHSFRSSLALLALGVSAGLTGCMVVPLDPQPYRTASAAPTPVLVPAAPSSQLLQVRLYPLNAEANQAGALQAVVMDGMNGRGSFTLGYRGHNLSGEATRVGPEYPGFGALIGATTCRNVFAREKAPSLSTTIASTLSSAMSRMVRTSRSLSV